MTTAGISGKVAIVTGGAAGLGAATVRRLAADGARVVIADIDDTSAATVVDDTTRLGGDVVFRHTDIGSAADVRDFVSWVAGAYGHIDVLVNVAAFLPKLDSPRGRVRWESKVADIDLDLWDDELRVSLTGAMLVSKYTIPHMLAAGGGSIIHFSSAAGTRAMEQNTSYGVVKAGVIALSRGIAAEYGKAGIRSNTIAPGSISAGSRPPEYVERARYYSMTGDLGEGADVAAIVAFLAGDDSRLLTAQVIAADSGLTMRLPRMGTPK